MQRFDWQEMREYWRTEHAGLAGLDLEGDPDGLNNVCHTGAPRWLNEYYARYQTLVYRELLARIPAKGPEARALDVGCGAGRWCKLLADSGYEAEGLDLQTDLLELNRARYPHITFHDGAIQAFDPDRTFDLVSSVTVIAHNPFDQQMQVIQKLRALLETGGHAIILENVNDQAPHVFANSPERWRELFEAAGFRLRHQIAYDYSPAIRAISAARSKLVPARQETPAKPMLAQVNGDGQNAIRRLRLMAQRVAVFVDDQVEGVLVRRQPTFRSVHAGFLFEAI